MTATQDQRVQQRVDVLVDSHPNTVAQMTDDLFLIHSRFSDLTNSDLREAVEETFLALHHVTEHDLL